MRCEAALELLPDLTVGTLSGIEEGEVLRHLRGCAGCRADAAALGEGMTTFASAVPRRDPPAELRERVLGVLGQEWSAPAAPPPRAGRFRRGLPWLATAAAIVLLAGALAWGLSGRLGRDRLAAEAAGYRSFLHALGGRDVRVATLRPVAGGSVEGSAILYDSDRGQSWVLVLVRSPGLTGTATASLRAADGRTVRLRPMELDADGDGSAWLVTSADISALRTVTVADERGRLLASGEAVPNTQA